MLHRSRDLSVLHLRLNAVSSRRDAGQVQMVHQARHHHLPDALRATLVDNTESAVLP